MVKGDTFKLILIGVLLSLSLLIVLPFIPIVVDSSIFSTNSQIGGYEIKIASKGGEKTLDLKDFKKGSGAGESKKIVFKLESDAVNNKDQALSNAVGIIEKRLRGAGIAAFQTGVQEDGNFFVILPEFESYERVSNLVVGSGSVDFKKVKNPSDWSQEYFTNFYLESDRWDNTELSESDMYGFRYFVSPDGKSGTQIAFTPEGRKKFYDLATNNIGLPISIYVNESEYPILMPVISPDILSNTNMDPSVTGGFSEQAINDINLQINNPISSKISSVEVLTNQPSLGYDFLVGYLKALIVGLFFISIIFVLRFKSRGLILTVSIAMSFLLFLALAKLIPIYVNPDFILGFIILTGMLSILGYISFDNLLLKVKSGKPLDYALYEVFGKEKERMATPSIFFLLLFTTLTFFTSSGIKDLMTSLSVGSLVLIVFYSFILPTLLSVFGGIKK